jgi:hypothetical protein
MGKVSFGKAKFVESSGRAASGDDDSVPGNLGQYSLNTKCFCFFNNVSEIPKEMHQVDTKREHNNEKHIECY